MGVRRAMALIGDARRATGEGKSDPVETGLTGPAATALLTLVEAKGNCSTSVPARPKALQLPLASTRTEQSCSVLVRLTCLFATGFIDIRNAGIAFPEKVIQIWQGQQH